MKKMNGTILSKGEAIKNKGGQKGKGKGNMSGKANKTCTIKQI